MDENAMMDRISVGLLRMLCIAIKLEAMQIMLVGCKWRRCWERKALKKNDE